MTKPASLEIIHAYRHLYKGLLRAIQFSKPARFSARRQMRTAFREEGAKFDPQAIERTLLFLDAATRERGLEHRILKNLLRIGWDRRPGQVTWKRSLLQAKLNRGRTTELEDHVNATNYNHYDRTIEMLNKSMGLCLR